MSEQQQTAAAGESGQQVDRKFMDLYSRQIGTYGMDTMVRLISLKVLILGCRATGAEAAKNLCLAGVHSVGLYDPAPCTAADQGGNFCVTQEHLDGKTSRAAATNALVKQLNPNTRTSVVPDASDATIQQYDVVIATSAYENLGKSELDRINTACRARKPLMGSFVAAFNFGAIGSIFVDHGPGFVTKDPDGRAALQKQISEVVTRTDKKGRQYTRLRLAVPEGMQPGALRDVTEVTFSDVNGFVHTDSKVSVNDEKTPFPAWHGLSDPPNTVRIYPSMEERGYSAYEGGGFVHECKEKTVRDFRTFAECLAVPPSTITTDAFFGGMLENNVHLMVAALTEYADSADGGNGKLPPVLDGLAAGKILSIAQAINARGEKAKADAPAPVTPAVAGEEDPLNEMPAPLPPAPAPAPFVVDYMDEDFVKRATITAAAELQPLCTILGAIVAQEVVKVTGKFTPIYQFLHLNMSSVLPDEQPDDKADDAAVAVADRYADMRALFGSAFVKKLQNLKMFMVGCGALGCEYIKNFALCGICCGPDGKLTVTDNDRIEVSNLNRQFLFREENVGQQKSAAAGQRAQTMNGDLKIDARQDLVADTTEHLFDDDFWMSLDVVCNALDNMKARLYVDAKCVLLEKVLMEAGTTGTGGNVDIVVPHKTESYAAGGGADESGGIPMCTLRNFPYIYDHCIEWARAQFEDLFVSPIMMTSQLKEDPAAFKAKMESEVFTQSNLGLKRSLLAKNLKTLQALKKVADVLTADKVDMQSCIDLAWAAFHTQFRDRIASLIKALPADATKKNGEKFWSGHRKFPTALSAGDLTDDDVREYLVSSANLFACMLGVHGEKHPPVGNDPAARWKAEYRTDEWIKGAVAKLPVPTLELSAVDDLDEETSSSAKAGDVSDESQEAEFRALLDEVTALGAKLPDTATPLDFEKDDDDNFHIDFVAAAANLRARNYAIATKDRLTVKMIAGKIIPAIATTTAAVTGFALLEYFKVLQGKDASSLRNGQIELGTNMYTMFDRDPPAKVKSHVRKTYDAETDYTMEEPIVAFPNPHTPYDKIVVDVTPATTIAEFADALQSKSESAEEGPYELVSLGVGKGLLWDGMPKHANYKKSLMTAIVEMLEKDPAAFWKGRRMYPGLAVNLESADGNEVLPAPVVLRIC